MTPESGALRTHYAPAERAGDDVLDAESRAFLENRLAVALLEAIPELALVLNQQRQVIAANRPVLEALEFGSVAELRGRRPGELVDCVHVADSPNGCGTSEHCSVCGALDAVLTCLRTGRAASRECRLRTTREADGGALDVEVQASPLEVDGLRVTVVVLRDISAAKRREILERTFLHDLLNLTFGMQAVTYLLQDPDEDPERQQEYHHDLQVMVEQLTDEVRAHRQLLDAERGDLKPNPETVSVADLLDSVGDIYRRHGVAEGRSLRLSPLGQLTLVTDPVLVRRVLGNLVKNAFEATAEGGQVTVGAAGDERGVTFWVNNPGIIPEPVRRQIFQRSFSTKDGPGRGLGTHSVKLLVERYLRGRVTFVSGEPEGTTFYVWLPRG